MRSCASSHAAFPLSACPLKAESYSAKHAFVSLLVMVGQALGRVFLHALYCFAHKNSSNHSRTASCMAGVLMSFSFAACAPVMAASSIVPGLLRSSAVPPFKTICGRLARSPRSMPSMTPAACGFPLPAPAPRFLRRLQRVAVFQHRPAWQVFLQQPLLSFSFMHPFAANTAAGVLAPRVMPWSRASIKVPSTVPSGATSYSHSKTPAACTGSGSGLITMVVSPCSHFTPPVHGCPAPFRRPHRSPKLRCLHRLFHPKGRPVSARPAPPPFP